MGCKAIKFRRVKIIIFLMLGLLMAGGVAGQEMTAGRAAGRPLPFPALDTDGQPIDAHGGGVLLHDGVYYLFGEVKKGRTRLVPGQNWEDYRVDAGGVSCYFSRDLVHWTYKGIALAPDSTDTASDLHISKVIERPKVIYNEATKQFVMWMHIDKNDYGYARAGVAVSDKPQGPYRYLGCVRPNGQMCRDMTAFRDDDGRAYLVYASENNNTMQVCLLSKDYLSPTQVYQRILIGQRREAPAVFKSGSRYYLITSLCSGWDPNPARVAVADSMMGSWVQEGNPCVGKDSGTTFSSQSAYVLPLSGGSFLFMADRWNKTDLEHSGYLWLPFKVEDGRVEIRDEEGQRVDIGPLSLISYDVKLKSGYSFLRCYDSADHLLLEYQSKGGNYTETPPGTAYVVIGATGGAGDWKIEPNIGETGARHAPLCNLRQYLQPFWLSDTIYNETVLLYSTAGGAAEGRCLYRPDKIFSVRNFSLDTVYHEGIDYIMHDRTLTRMPGSRMPFRADTSFDMKNDLAWYNLQSQWVVVTYTHHDKWEGPTPSYQGDRLPRLMRLLHSGRPVSVVAYGMSITRGMDVSGYDRVAPYMPTYMELFVQGLKRRYPRSAVTLHNAGLPGSTVSWGAQYAEYYIPPLHPDLVVIDFGMNDFWRMPPAEFGDSIRTIIRKVRLADPAAEFLLLGNMTFDPAYVLDSDSTKAFYTGNMAGYAAELRKLVGPGVAMLDMTDISKAIYRRKKAKDCIANPLHPNDYMARWYAQGMVEAMCPATR
jgi:lysophospholipase L1-like esterase